MTREEFSKLFADELAKGGEAQVKAIAGQLNEYLVAKFGPAAAVPEYKGPGTQFIEAIKEAEGDRLALMATGHGKVVGTSQIPVKIDGWGLKAGEYRAPVLKANVVSTQFPSERSYLPFVREPRRRIYMRDIIPVAGLSTPQLEYARVTGFDNSAGGVAEAATKPESGLITALVTDSVKQIATWMPVSRRALRDVDGLGAYLNSILGYFLALEEDDQILNGAGGVDMNGILNAVGVQTQALGGDTRLDAIRKAMTKIQTGFSAGTAGWEPTGLVLHPSDWEDIELLKDLNLRYLLIPEGTATGDGTPQPPRVWRVPVVVTPAIAAGTGLMGAFDIGATLFTYEDVTLRISDSHASFFVQNLVAVLAEFRELLAIYYPAAFCKITGI